MRNKHDQRGENHAQCYQAVFGWLSTLVRIGPAPLKTQDFKNKNWAMWISKRFPFCNSARCGMHHVQLRHGSTRHKIMSADDAVHLIKSGDTITVGGFSGQNAPEEILSALANRFKTTRSPENLTLMFGGGPGDGFDKGINHFAQEGMLKRAIGAHYGQAPQLGAMALENKIEAYNLPLGSISRMIRAAASKLPGHVTTIGFGTLADPMFGGGKVNKITTEDLVESVEVYLFEAFSLLCCHKFSIFRKENRLLIECRSAERSSSSTKRSRLTLPSFAERRLTRWATSRWSARASMSTT